MIVLALPMPPSVNSLYRNVPHKGRVKTERYKAWIEEAGWRVKLQNPGHISGKYTLEIGFQRTRGDLDGRLKALIDLLVTMGVTDDDKHLEGFPGIWWRDDITGAVVTVRAA